MQFTIIGNPENRRITAFCDALRQLGYNDPTLIAYADLLSGRAGASISPGSIVKIDSPGENETVRTLLVARGKGRDTIKPAEHGEIKDMRAWYNGYCSWLQEIKTGLQQPGVRVMNAPDDIQLQFNKPVCQAFLQQQGVPVPNRLPAFTHYDELVQHMQQQRIQKVFIKPAHASSASGVIAFRKAGHRVQAVTAAEMVATGNGLQLFNSLNVFTYTREADIAALVNRMVEENIFAEEWLPKATLNNRFFDVRVLTIAGKARHTVIRTSDHVLTNLHLGNRRGDMNEFLSIIGKEKLQQVKQLAEQAAACFPSSLYMGIDLLLTAGLRKSVVLEINAFGDLLPGLVHEGETCYEAQINAMIKKQEQLPIC
jgi:glutathione synthase/RimK-type ligase-like ATP-grasp enzyme